MKIGIFERIRIGIRLSNPDTVLPMRAAALFVKELRASAWSWATRRVQCELYGSSAATGKEYGAAQAVLLGLEGTLPERVDPGGIESRSAQIRSEQQLMLGGKHAIIFDDRRDLLIFDGELRLSHPSGMRFAAFDATDALLLSKTYHVVNDKIVVEAVNGGRSALMPGPLTPASTSSCRRVAAA